MKLKNNNISIEIDDKTGATTGIYDPHDKYLMNWVLDNSSWGLIDGFKTVCVSGNENKITVLSDNESVGVQVSIEKEITKDKYYEKFFITNIGEFDFFLTKENFGIPFPYSCNFTDSEDVLNDRSINHVWCGGDCCWMYSSKCSGKAPYLVMHTTEGRIDDYSISYDISRTYIGAFYRGVIVLNPKEQIILPGETVKLSFCFEFSDLKPEVAPLPHKEAIRFVADKYTAQKGEKISLTIEKGSAFENISILCDGVELNTECHENVAFCSCVFDEIGEKKIIAEIDGKTTWLFVNIIPSVSDLLQKRARFITEKQQYHCEGSHLDGAYLIYDNETNSLYCSNGENDHNACRERIGMGVLVCKALQEKYDESLMRSLKEHRKFVEREVFDTETYVVFNGIGKSKRHNRIFNYPWLSTYYLEWFELTDEKKCIEYAANILLKFFEITSCSGSAQCIEIVRICSALEKKGLKELREKLIEEFITYADNITKSTQLGTKEGIIEVLWCNELPCSNMCYQAQAYILTEDEKYREIADAYANMTKAYFAMQPDFHLNCVPVRHWDNFWFGKYACYGDVFPHYWSALAGWGLAWYDEAKGQSENQKIIQSNLLGNLCIYKADGSARNNYLYPYKITLYTSDPNYENEGLKPKIDYGKRYDPWANDQDWALYYASRFAR